MYEISDEPPRDESADLPADLPVEYGITAHEGDAMVDHGILPTGPEHTGISSGERYIDDPELAQLITEQIEQSGVEAVDRILEAHEPYNYTGYGDGQRGDYYKMRRFLGKMPEYLETASLAGATPEDAHDVMAALLTGASGYCPEGQFTFLYPSRTSRIFAAAARAEQPVTPEDITALKELGQTAGATGLTRNGLGVTAAGVRAGLSIADSAQLASDTLRQVNSLTHVICAHTYDALKDIYLAGADPADIKTVFGALPTMRSFDQIEALELFKDAIMGVPQGGTTGSDTVRLMADHIRDGADLINAVDSVRQDQQQAGRERLERSQHNDPAFDTAERERIFIDKPGGLEHALQPYKTVRSLNDGVRDLEQLTGSISSDGSISEGAWIFDPQTNTWYSYGGHTEYLGIDHLRHTHYVDYHPGKLTETPYSFHIHPQAGSTSPLNEIGMAFPTDADVRYVSIMYDTAQQPVRMRSFISHTHGITEFSYPHDPAAISAAVDIMEQTRDELFGALHRTGQPLDIPAGQAGEQEFTRQAIDTVSQQLPEGFSLTLYPPGSDMEAILGEQQHTTITGETAD